MARGIHVIVLLLCMKVFCEGSGGTTLHLREIFLGRCHEFQQLKSNNGNQHKDCHNLYDLFVKAVKSQQGCSKKNNSNAFDAFFELVNPGKTPVNKAVFWSGTMELARELSTANENYVTMEHTLPGYIANGLTFCGGNSSGVFNHVKCKCSWPSSIAASFWNAASKQFAKNAQGIVSVLVNGTRTDGKPAYRDNSIFAEVELPNINASQVGKIKILVGWDLTRKPEESCGTKSIKKLQMDIEKKGIKGECIDEPRAAFYILCANYPNSSACKKHLATGDVSLNKWKTIGKVFIAISIVLLAIIIILPMYYFRRGKSSKEEPKSGENTSLVKV